MPENDQLPPYHYGLLPGESHRERLIRLIALFTKWEGEHSGVDSMERIRWGKERQRLTGQLKVLDAGGDPPNVT